MIDVGADTNALVGEGKHFPLELAARSGNLAKVQVLLDGGADVNLASPKGYTALIYAMYALHADFELLPVIDVLVKNGADIDCTTDYGEFPLGVASFQGRFDAVRYLLEVGADSTPLRWTDLMRAIAVGSCTDVEKLLHCTPDLTAKDRFDRTPLLLAAAVGDPTKVELLYSKGASLDQRGRMGDSALIAAASRGKSDIVHLLLDHGAAVDAADDAGNTALMTAAQAGSTEAVRHLLKAGADPGRRGSDDQNAMKMASNEAVIRLLAETGQDIGDISTEMKRQLLGMHKDHVWTISKAEYVSGCCPRFGKSNPEVMKIPFWHEMVKAGISAYSAKMQFGENDILAGPVWCFNRFGMSFTESLDGSFVQIGGEHEDFYDPDFCIYNDVLIHDQSGSFQIMGYPKQVFPPTDFHSATYLDGYIYIVGGLGYQGERKFGATPVYRLDCRTWLIEPLACFKNNPGWIFKHKAVVDGSQTIAISGGTICQELNGEEQHVANEEQFVLDVQTMMWSRS